MIGIAAATWLLGCQTGPQAANDSACTGPALDVFASEEAGVYADWLYACPNPPDWADHDETAALVAMSWTASGRSVDFDTCHAQDCLDTLAAGLPTCADDGDEWLEIADCRLDYIMPP